MRFSNNVIFWMFIGPIIVLYGEYTLGIPMELIAATAILSVIALELMRVVEQRFGRIAG